MIYGNVVNATHGETRQEVLGSGNASLAFQTFFLKQAPLTFTSAPTPSGIASTLEVRVNDLRWPEVDGLIWLDPDQRGYITKTGDDDKTSVIFGDGEHGLAEGGIGGILAERALAADRLGELAGRDFQAVVLAPGAGEELRAPLAEGEPQQLRIQPRQVPQPPQVEALQGL